MRPGAPVPPGHGPRAEYPGDGPVVVARTTDGRRAQELSLVLRAVGIVHEARPSGALVEIVVAPADGRRAGEQLRRYVEENAAAPVTLPWKDRPLAHGLRGAFAYIVILVLVDRLDRTGAFGFDWTAAGRTHAESIRQGEVYRAVTALTLHTGAPHMAGNAAFGAFFATFVGQLLGNGCGLAAILFTGVLGNLANAWLQPPAHLSVGASTAVFGALGLLVASSFAGRRRVVHGTKRWAPLVCGVALLGYLGTAGERTDVFAHVFGFVAGCLVGLPLSNVWMDGPPSPRVQWSAGLSALALLVGAWCWALG